MRGGSKGSYGNASDVSWPLIEVNLRVGVSLRDEQRYRMCNGTDFVWINKSSLLKPCLSYNVCNASPTRSSLERKGHSHLL